MTQGCMSTTGVKVIMLIFSTLIILVFVYFDIRVLKKLDESLWEKSFQFSKSMKYLFVSFIMLILLIGVKDGKWETAQSFLIAFLGPIYVVKRFNFRKRLIQTRPEMLTPERPASLAFLFDTFSIIMLWFVGSVAVAVFSKIVFKLMPSLNSELGWLVFVAGFSSVLMVGLIYFFLRQYPDIDILSILGLRPRGQSPAKIIIVPIFVGLLCAVVSSMILIFRQVKPATPLSEILDTTSSSQAILTFLVLAILIAPLLEEIIFRGYFFYVLEKLGSRALAIVVVTALFAFLH